MLVDRIWPRGLKKADAALDLWLKGVAPSPELRRWFGHDPAKWAEFRRRYAAELDHPEGVLVNGRHQQPGYGSAGTRFLSRKGQ